MHVCIFFVLYILFAPFISTSIHRCVNNSHDIKILMKIIETETFNVRFSSQWIHIMWIILFFYFLRTDGFRSTFTFIFWTEIYFTYFATSNLQKHRAYSWVNPKRSDFRLNNKTTFIWQVHKIVRQIYTQSLIIETKMRVAGIFGLL